MGRVVAGFGAAGFWWEGFAGGRVGATKGKIFGKFVKRP
jgi:hypothetical protein